MLMQTNYLRKKVSKVKRKVIVATSRELTKEERKNYKKENPGYRLCFRLRFPDFPIYVGALAVIIMLLNIVISIGYAIWLL